MFRIKIINWIWKYLELDKLHQSLLNRGRQIDGMQRMINSQQCEIDELRKELKKYQSVSMDLGFTPDSQNTIILTGHLNGREYVETFQVSYDEFRHLVERMKEMKKHYRFQAIDAPPQFRAILEHEGLVENKRRRNQF